MRKGIVWTGIVVVLAGSLMVFMGGFLMHVGYGTMMTALEDLSDAAVREGYDQLRNGQLIAHIGMFLAFMGIAVGLGGMTVEPPPSVSPSTPPRPAYHEYTPPQMPSQPYPPEEPPYPPQH